MAIKDSVDSFPSEVLDGRASIDIKNEIDRLRADQHELIFYSQFYVKKVQNDCQTRLENNSEKIDKMQDMLGIVLRKENAEQQLQRKLGATWVDISDMTTLFLTGLRDYSLDRDEQRFLDMMQGFIHRANKNEPNEEMKSPSNDTGGIKVPILSEKNSDSEGRKDGGDECHVSSNSSNVKCKPVSRKREESSISDDEDDNSPSKRKRNSCATATNASSSSSSSSTSSSSSSGSSSSEEDD